MKPISVACFLLCLLLSNACKQESYTVEIDLDLQDPTITTLSDGTKQLDFTIVVTQLGNFYHQDFRFEFKEFGGTGTLIDSFNTVLPTAREFVRRTVIVPKGGDYWAETWIGTESSGASSGTMITVPE